ncbi:MULTISPECIES: ABC transporter substrate-binding protein [Paenibacillus]|uniref:ABC transporter substrate-binding protein n=1 Tax=Paenibacillus TaxID=44249 RepID=UPI0022B90F6A|nr:extracellular solute-binding protein [Paenibacillus caseinilyticus]MCZ8521335.1 extracellular solute-binding protein [Paenibacillus caseinilyticus]
MKAVIHSILVAALLIAAGWHAKRGGTAPPEGGKSDKAASEWTAAEDARGPVKLKIWMPDPMLETEIRDFQSSNPNIDIEVVSLAGSTRITERYREALASGSAPDLLVLTHGMLGSFNGIEELADLSDSPLPLAEYREQMGEYLWNIHRSLDSKRLIAVPFQTHPNVLFYRADLFERAGFPSEPDQLAAFLEEPDHVVNLVSSLSENGISTIQWNHDFITVLSTGNYMFSPSFEFQRMSAMYRNAASVSFRTKAYIANTSIWLPEGHAMLKEGRLAAVMMPDWGENQLAEWLPEQAGLWRVTRLPLGGSSIDLVSSNSIAVTAQSRNKAAAAKFLDYLRRYSGSLNWDNSTSPSPFLGGQLSKQLYLKLTLSQPVTTIPTPLDPKAFDRWRTSMEMAIDQNIPPEEMLESAKNDVLDVLAVPLEQLREFSSDWHSEQ